MAAKKKSAETTAAKPVHYTRILSPVITEKTTAQSDHNQVTFMVPCATTKPEIKEAVEAIWGVAVKSVNTITIKGKTKRSPTKREKTYFRSDSKKAIVTLAAGQTIDIGTGV
jgi:large subunit ribosomal protein L23